MSPKLRNLLVAAGVVVIGGTATQVYLSAPGVTAADLADAGVAEQCAPVVMRLNLHAPAGVARARLEDAGLTLPDFDLADGGVRERKVAQVLTRAYQCDGGLVLPFESDEREGPFVVGDAELLTDAGNGPLRPQLDEQCGCRRRLTPGTCRYLDGGIPPPDTELAPGTFLGDCTPKTCGELAGELGSSMPEACQ